MNANENEEGEPKTHALPQAHAPIYTLPHTATQ